MPDLFAPRFRHLSGMERRRIPATPAGHLRLHRLERPEPWPEPFQAILRDAASLETIQQYPDYPPFYERLSAFMGVPARNIVVGAGIEEFIRTLTFLCCEPGDRVAFTDPTCAMFGLYAEAFGAEPARIVCDPDAPPTVSDVLAVLEPGVRLLILPNPGQPVETCFSLDELRRIARRCAETGCVFAIDEAYHWFGAPSAIPLIGEFDNVLVLRTLSKAFGAAGLRVGWAMGADSVIRVLDAARPSGEIAGPSLRIASAMLDHWDEYIAPGIAEVRAGRDWLRDTLRGDGFSVTGSVANKVLIDMDTPEAADVIESRLRRRGVHVRRSLSRHVMVTCGGPDPMRRFYSAFCEAL